MSLFKVDRNQPFEGPHQKLKSKTYGASAAQAKAAVILVHGRGASAESMFPLADEFNQPEVHFVAPQAANHTWYPHSFLEPIEKNQPGLSSGLQLLHDTLSGLLDEGIDRRKIMLLGFSQGSCLASEFVARYPQQLGGLAAFSGGLIGPVVNLDQYKGSVGGTPVFLGCSDSDPHIPKERVDKTEEVFKKLKADVTKRIYKVMGHTINRDEIQFVSGMIDEMLKNTSGIE